MSTTEQLSNTIALLEACKLELGKIKPDYDRAYDFAERAFDLVGLARIQDAAATRKGVNHG